MSQIPVSAELLQIEAATAANGERIGLRLTLSPGGQTVLVYADQQAMPGFRVGKEFTPELDEVVTYTPLASPQDSAGAVAQCTNEDSWNCKYCSKTESCEALKDPRNFGAPQPAGPAVDALAFEQHLAAEGWCPNVARQVAAELIAWSITGPAVEVAGEREAEAFAYGEAVERKAKEIYEGWSGHPGYVPWVSGGNAMKQDEARRLAVAALAQTSGGETP